MDRAESWEYRHLISGYDDEGYRQEIEESKLNELGKEGWEVVSIREAVNHEIISVFLKRKTTHTE